METITASITMPLENFEAYANSKGYQDFVYDPEDDTKTIPNTETRMEYAKRMFIEYAVADFVKVAENAIRVEKNKETQALVETKKDELRAAIAVS